MTDPHNRISLLLVGLVCAGLFIWCRSLSLEIADLRLSLEHVNDRGYEAFRRIDDLRYELIDKPAGWQRLELAPQSIVPSNHPNTTILEPTR